ncbi:MAG: hypothetical protein GY859_25755 [Desulfobacterales bacterium]|nr:hypothetical protein [Desulfobacterales bacterium]
MSDHHPVNCSRRERIPRPRSTRRSFLWSERQVSVIFTSKIELRVVKLLFVEKQRAAFRFPRRFRGFKQDLADPRAAGISTENTLIFFI